MRQHGAGAHATTCRNQIKSIQKPKNDNRHTTQTNISGSHYTEGHRTRGTQRGTASRNALKNNVQNKKLRTNAHKESKRCK